jgi:peptide deformylase
VTARTIVRYPDQRLRARAEAVTAFGPVLRALAQDLEDTMLAADGVGIAAPHIGEQQRVVVLKLPDDTLAHVYVNPVITWSSAETVRHEEGSISMRGVTEHIVRPVKVRLTYQDLDGNEKTEEAEGFRAVCHQHEIDQLDGVFWIDKLSGLKKERLLTKFKKLST